MSRYDDYNHGTVYRGKLRLDRVPDTHAQFLTYDGDVVDLTEQFAGVEDTVRSWISSELGAAGMRGVRYDVLVMRLEAALVSAAAEAAAAGGKRRLDEAKRTTRLVFDAVLVGQLAHARDTDTVTPELVESLTTMSAVCGGDILAQACAHKEGGE